MLTKFFWGKYSVQASKIQEPQKETCMSRLSFIAYGKRKFTITDCFCGWFSFCINILSNVFSDSKITTSFSLSPCQNQDTFQVIQCHLTHYNCIKQQVKVAKQILISAKIAAISQRVKSSPCGTKNQVKTLHYV